MGERKGGSGPSGIVRASVLNVRVCHPASSERHLGMCYVWTDRSSITFPPLLPLTLVPAGDAAVYNGRVYFQPKNPLHWLCKRSLLCFFLARRSLS